MRISSKLEAGRTTVNLSVDLGHLNPEAVPQQPHHGRKGPARKRQRERRAAARCQAEAVEASKSAEKAETSSANALDNNEKVVENGQNLINKDDTSKQKPQSLKK